MVMNCVLKQMMVVGLQHITYAYVITYVADHVQVLVNNINVNKVYVYVIETNYMYT